MFSSIAFIRFAYQFEQVRGFEDFDAELPCRAEVPFAKTYHKITAPGNGGFQNRVIAWVG